VTEHYRGLPHVYWPTTPANNDAALQHFKNAIAVDPSYPPPYGGAAGCLALRRMNNWTKDIAEDDAQLLCLAERVKELNTDDAFTLNAIGTTLFHNKVDCETGIELVDQAIRSNPNFAWAYQSRGYLQVWDGKSDTAIADFEQAMRLSPRDAWTFSSIIGIAFGHYNAGRYAEAALWADKFIRASPSFLGGLRIAIACYVGAGRMEDAQKVAADLRRLSAKGLHSKEWPGPARSREVIMKMREALLKAGLPE
jgi:tetratricopeptide (TPR) repeat protein